LERRNVKPEIGFMQTQNETFSPCLRHGLRSWDAAEANGGHGQVASIQVKVAKLRPAGRQILSRNPAEGIKKT